MRKGRNVLHTEKTCVTSCGYHWAARQTTKPPLRCVSTSSHMHVEEIHQSCPPKIILGAPTSFASAAMSSDARLRP